MKQGAGQFDFPGQGVEIDRGALVITSDHRGAAAEPAERLAERQASMEGFAFFHFPDSIAPATAELAAWLADGSLRCREEILDGIDRYPEALQFMFQGGNTGKLLVKIS